MIPLSPKYDGEVGPSVHVTEIVYVPYLFRFLFDTAAVFVLKILILNMVAGIIIDTFGALKDELMNK